MIAIAHYSKALSSIFRDFISLFFPTYCFGCNNSIVKGEDILCTRCIINLPKTDYHLQETNPIKERLVARMPIDNVYVFLKFNKKGSVQRLLHQLKYNNRPEIGIIMGKIYGMELSKLKLLTQYDLIIPVPLHIARRRKRGYNQSTQFAEGLSLVLGIKTSEAALIKAVSTSSQTKKSRIDRWENVKSVFRVINKNLVIDKSIILVDDVITTGATIEAVSSVLHDAGCKRITVICIAEA